MIETLQISCLAFIIANPVKGFIEWLYPDIRIPKPFSCTSCLSFWIMLIVCYKYAPVAFVLGMIIEYIYAKQKNTF